MAVVPKKTYSRRNNECILSGSEKENVDPFDELLSSPLKQDLQFKPLSFWDRKTKDSETRKKSKNTKWELYETSNSDDNSPSSRKKNSRLKFAKHRMKTLPLKSISNSRNNVFSNVRSFFKSSRFTKSSQSVENTTPISCEEFGKHSSNSSDNIFNAISSTSPTINSFHKSCDGFPCLGVKEKTGRESGTRTAAGCSGSGLPCTLKIKKNGRKDIQNSLIEPEKQGILKDQKFKVCKDIIAVEETLEDLYDKTLIHNEIEESENLLDYNSKTLEETIKPFYRSSDDFRFINMKRHFTNFNNSESLNNDSSRVKDNQENPKNSKIPIKEIETPESLIFLISGNIKIPEGKPLGSVNEDIANHNDEEESVTGATFYSVESTTLGVLNATEYEGDDEISNCDDEEEVMQTTFCACEIMGEKCPHKTHAAAMNEETKTSSLPEFQTENTDPDKCSFVYDSNNNSEDFTQDSLLEWNENSIGGADSSSASEENPFCLTEEESVITVNLPQNTNKSLNSASNGGKESPHTGSSPKEFANLATSISNLTISSDAEPGETIAQPKAGEEVQNQENEISRKDKKNDSVFIDLRNVTTKRKYRLNGRYHTPVSDPRESLSRINPPEETRLEDNPEREWESSVSHDHLGMADRTNFDWNKTICFANPIFESTRVQDTSGDPAKFQKATNQSQKMGESQLWLDHSYALKPGKKWLRSVSVLKQIRNGSIIGDRLESTRIKGRKFESFVKDMLEMQTGKSGWSASVADLAGRMSTVSGLRKPFRLSGSSDLESDNSLREITFKASDFSFDGTLLETSLVNPTIKVIHPEEKPSTFGLRVSSSALSGEISVPEKSSGMSGRDFILHQCGQDDVLPFEEYFNERTLKDCKKIGEGVYGEVFMSGDVVIKIIPIEGSDKVNGEPQKTFEEILSEVVIASKLSNLRSGEKNRTDGFSEVKRCWCVRGRYPEYLLRLWNEYDQSGGGSENDSPVMFEEDQLYVILELANGGKNLESFLFSSASQSLSVFVQTAFSLAVAEKEFEFEHRDLHWGNILVSETKDKFVTVVLEDVEYKIPSKGVKVCIIDFTLSRIYHQGFCIFNDLSVDPALFTSEGDYQFEIYRMMLKEVRNDWSLFRPKTNIFWLHYTLDKMINMVRYKNKKTKLHKKGERGLKILESTVLDYKDTTDFVEGESLRGVIKTL